MEAFHPIVASWFGDAFESPTEVQEQAWPCIQRGENTLIAAPTGAGKTLAAFLVAIDRLLRKSLEGTLVNETMVVYVSPLKALSTDVDLNLSVPLKGIQERVRTHGYSMAPIRTAVRTGDTSASRRAAMLRKPPHILVTTPESLYLLVTAKRSREILETVRTVIVDEIHAVLPSRRGAHLALTLERLAHVSRHSIQRIGLSATQRPVSIVASYLTGCEGDCTIVDLGHNRKMELALELPQSPLEAIMAHEVWAEIYDRLAELATDHRTTLVFTSTRHLAERIARHLGERLGRDNVSAHHGSLAHARRRDAEIKLKRGELRVLVATASLELGIDIGSVDLVCQIGSPRSISTFLQRVGRAGHYIGGIAKGRLFPITRDDLLECVALLAAVHDGVLERVKPQENPIDVLAQQIVAEASAEDWQTDALYELFKRAWPYRNLSRDVFDATVAMTAQGFDTAHGRRGALIYHDAINGRISGRPAARLISLTSGGAIPDSAEYRVVMEPTGTPVGKVHEDFAVESFAGDVFQLGSSSWRILKVDSGVVRVEDAQGAPPTFPFWLGESNARSDELSRALSKLRETISPYLDSHTKTANWLEKNKGLPGPASVQIAEYLVASRESLGVLPLQEELVAERFFDDSGGTQLVIHTPYGARVNRAWGLALRKRLCQIYNCDLQAAATENNILLSFGPQHSFPIEDLFKLIESRTVRDILVQAVLEAPMFHMRWRWVMNIALAVPRARGGKKVAPQLQRMQAEDILLSIFPDAGAHLENLSGERTPPRHPLVDQVLEDCLQEAMDCKHLQRLLEQIQSGAIQVHAVNTLEPSSLAQEVLAASPYAFLDDAPLQERRAQAVYRRRAFEPSRNTDIGYLDAGILEEVLEEAQPRVRSTDELHDLLLTAGCLNARQDSPYADWFDELVRDGRAVLLHLAEGEQVWVATERLKEALMLWEQAVVTPSVKALDIDTDASEAMQNFVLGLMEAHAPMTAEEVAARLYITRADAESALIALEGRGALLRGNFTQNTSGSKQWCHRGILAQVYRRTVDHLRAEISPVTQADYVRFLFAWQKAAPAYQVAGQDGLLAVLKQLSGFALQAAAWESDVLPVRVRDYSPAMLDLLCMTGQVQWFRAVGSKSAPIRSTSITLCVREDCDLFSSGDRQEGLSAVAEEVLEVLTTRGASFLHELENACNLLPTQIESALQELVSYGVVTSDGFAGLRFLLTPVDKRRKHRGAEAHLNAIGRWSILVRGQVHDNEANIRLAKLILARYGVICRRVLLREPNLPPWRDLVRIFWDMELRGKVRGGRFIAGVPGEQFGLPEAVGLLRRIRRDKALCAEPVGLSASDPLNLAGIVGPGDRLPALASNRMVYQSGEVVAKLSRKDNKDESVAPELRKMLRTQQAYFKSQPR